MIEKMSEDDWNAVVGVHLSGAFHCTQVVGREFLRRARERPDPVCNGKIVNVTSVAGLRGSVGQINYAAAKAGVVGLTMSAAREWGRYAINVNCVAFGLVETRMTERIRSDPKFKDQYLREIALGRYAKPEDVAPAVLFLASSDADYVTGQVLRVCGGAASNVERGAVAYGSSSTTSAGGGDAHADRPTTSRTLSWRMLEDREAVRGSRATPR
jgi:3-oxoacyl-[acyl-carrier protein] reductase